VRVKNTTGGTKTVLGRTYLGNQEFDADEELRGIFLRNNFTILDEIVEEVEEVVEEVSDDTASPLPDLDSMTKRELQAHLRSLGIPFKLSQNKSDLVGLLSEEE
tara:strand:- start:9813 stop:10124 length:312 start_codon:yes stop_codon:yes gene_type:complete